MAESQTRCPLEPYASFLVRIWIERKEDEQGALIAEVQSVQSGETWRFADIKDVNAFLSERVRELGL